MARARVTDWRVFERIFIRRDQTSHHMLPLSYEILKRQCDGKWRKMAPKRVFGSDLTDTPAECCHIML
jgi:predicted ATPase